VHLLGRFEVLRGDAPIPDHAWRRRRPADLLALVAISPGRTLPREAAMAALWPDKDAASGANNLHRALYDLRQILGGRWLDIERGQLSLQEDVWLDVDAFARAAEAGTREGRLEAVGLYRGDLLPEAPEPWLEPRRRQLRELFVAAAGPLAEEAAQAGDATAAVPLLRRVLEVEPLREEAHRELVRLLAVTGRRAEALRAYDSCEGALRAAGRVPAEETRSLRQAVQLGTLGPSQEKLALDGARRAARRLLGTSDPPPVRGRNALLLLLEALVERGAGMLVLLGERGVGKTRLAIEGARFAQGQGAAVLAATTAAWPGSPYGLFADLFRQERAGAAHDPLAAGATPGSDASRLGVHRAVTEELRALAAGRPLFLLLDDLHAADESSLNLVHDLALHAAELRLMLVATCRDDEIHAGRPIQTALAHLDVGGLARGVRLPRLSLAGTREQLADLLGEPPDAQLVSEVYRATDGSPFLVEETARAHQESRLVPADPAVSLRARVTRLGPRAEGLLSAAAVAGRRFDFELVQPVSGLSAPDAVRTLEECLAARLVDEDGSGYVFRHDLVRQCLYDGLPAGRRTALHAAVADALEALPGATERPEVLAHHRRLAGQDERALRHLVAAGHRAASRACLAEALGFYAEALELAPRAGAPPALRLELHDAAGRVQLALGETAAAAREFLQAARLMAADGAVHDPGPQARTQRLAALALGATGDLPGAFAAIDQGLALAAEGADEERAALLHLSAQLHYHEGRSAETIAAAQACREVARRSGDLDLDARGRDMEAIARALAGEPLAAVDDAIRAADRRAQDIAPEHPIDVHTALWDRDLLGDRTCAEVARGAAAITERARQRQAPEAVASGRYGEGVVALAAGQLDAAEALLRDAREAFRQAGIGTGEALALERLGTLLAQLGRFEEASELLAEGVVLAERGVLRRHVLTRLHVAEVRNRLAARVLGQAESAWREASASAARHGDCLSCDAVLRPEAVRVALAFGKVDDADAEAHALEELARQRGGRGLQAITRFARARVLAARGRTEDALVSLAQARAGFLAGGLRYEAARTARLEARLRGSLPEAWSSLDALVRVDADA
jgi:DNA-binding SARP family transcriptional activator/tetratricopeptide (TPR) repeat protein